MANSSTVSSLKERIIEEISNDEIFYYAIDPNPAIAKEGADLPDTYIFRYNKNPDIVLEAETFLTIMVDTKSRDLNKTFVTPTLTIFVYSHHRHMEVNNVPGIIENRNDYISKLLDKKLNGFVNGFGALLLVSNTEGVYNKEFLFRRLVFETVDLNKSLCEVV